MTQDHIIKAAQQAGFRTGNITLSDSDIKPIPFIAPASAADCRHEVARLYAIAFKAGMERAAEMFAGQPHVEHFGREIADAIHAEAHAKNQTEGN